MTARLRAFLSVFVAHLRAALRIWAGDDDYERYLRRCAQGRERPLDRGRYFALRMEERYRTTSRCC
jgi:uncharacterized short protein YbdD (DUF466 family)